MIVTCRGKLLSEQLTALALFCFSNLLRGPWWSSKAQKQIESGLIVVGLGTWVLNSDRLNSTQKWKITKPFNLELSGAQNAEVKKQWTINPKWQLSANRTRDEGSSRVPQLTWIQEQVGWGTRLEGSCPAGKLPSGYTQWHCAFLTLILNKPRRQEVCLYYFALFSDTLQWW